LGELTTLPQTKNTNEASDIEVAHASLAIGLIAFSATVN
jgi:hypothetical protein